MNEKYGRLEVISEPFLKVVWKHKKASFVKCRCDCGIEKEYRLCSIKNSNTKSCGCLTRELNKTKFTKHNLRYHPLYHTWESIKARCYNKNHKEYKNYGSRGIVICHEWKNNFKSFYDWAILNGWQKGLTIDRINNDGNYEPDNCRFTTQKIQANNRRSNKLLTIFNETKTMKQWSEDFRCKVKYNTIFKRLSLGYTPEQAITFECRKRII